MIDKTVIISSKAKIENDVTIGPYSVIGDHVVIKKGSVIGPHVVVDPFVEIGSNCHIFQYAAIGASPQSLKFKGERSKVVIGDNCHIREFVTIHRGTEFGGGVTKIGNNCFLMAYTHVAHDCIVGNQVVMANNATLAGHISIGNHATVGGLVAIHQFVRVGDYAFIGGKSAVTKDIPPYVIASGDRAKLHGLNQVGLKRHGFAKETVLQLKKAYRLIFRFGLTLNEAIERVGAEVDHLPEVNSFIDFIKSTQRGITR
ncbi:MAG: acyl-ACP--UDP-N-acetylglucosamine O-acyltransferase [Desulfobacteraceae bacterium]|nr:acyl-ACP--UDP-N-acetylglucosamine O-acyltransferase [Desulfobacteraceae bacterium]